MVDILDEITRDMFIKIIIKLSLYLPKLIQWSYKFVTDLSGKTCVVALPCKQRMLHHVLSNDTTEYIVHDSNLHYFGQNQILLYLVHSSIHARAA